MEKIKIVTGLFIILLILIVLAANLGWGTSLFSLVYIIPGGDKIGHFVLMGMLSFLVNLAFRCKRMRIFSLEVLMGSALILVIVTLEEFSQIFLRYRGFSLTDLFADYMGIIIFGKFALFIFERLFLNSELRYRRTMDG